jgi:molecular chaperone DnaK
MELAMQREQFERMCEPWLKRIETACRKIKGKPDRVLLIGGGALMPAVRRCVKEVFHLEPSPGADPLTAVARGAAIQAAILSGLLKDLLVLDAVPFSLGIKSFDQQKTAHLDVLIRKHATIPSEVKKVYTTMTDNQPAVTIEVFQGEDPVPGKNFKIGQFHLEGIPPAKAGVPQIEVTFGIDASCLLAITARDLGTHKERKIRIADSHLLTPAQLKDLEQHLQTARGRQEVIEKLEKIASLLTAFRADPTGVGLPELQRQFQQALAGYETHARRFAPGPSDEQVMLEIYRERNELESRVRLALDRWQTLRQSAEAWLAAVGKLSLETGGAHPQNAQVLEGEDLARRAKDAGRALADVAAIYRQWLNVLGGLPVSPDGEPEELARHFLRAGRWDEALVHFLRLEPPSSGPQIELGLEILARLRRRGEYAAVLRKHAELLGVQSPDFVRPNETVRLYVSSVAWIRVPSGAGSGFAIGPSQVATNRHVIIDPATGKPLLPSQVTIVSLHGETRVRSIHLSKTSGDDVAILDLESQDGLVPLRLGFAELVEVGERIVTIGFPAPGAGGFQENLFCNTGLVNRIRPSEQCSERVLEVSIELQGGISGAPILNELGEVVGMVTFAQMRGRAVLGGQIHFERSFFAIPVSVLRRVVAERPTLPG